MKTKFFLESTRGKGDFGWLKPNYYFSFSQYYHPERMNFGLLRVLNDDWILGGGKFPPHPHDNMEIITIPLVGTIEHRDNTGGHGLIKAGDVQIMSAGSGIQHSEANASTTDPLALFQIWIFPKIHNIQPRYDQRTFESGGRNNQWQTIVSPIEEENALWINQDARLSLTDLQKEKTITYTTRFQNNGVFLVVIEGSVQLDAQTLNRRDAIGIWDTNTFELSANSDATLLAIEVPMLMQ
jgi:redox-sensitive bicupin YhaK (pirin superfamily)